MKFLCKNIWEVEWSGVLFYSNKGDFGTPKFEITLEHILPMNKGSQAYTEFETDETLVNFLMDNPENLTHQKGLVHSHNSMNVFFSGTDMDEIKENSEFYNYYLSVIVNNKEEITAKIAFRGKNKEVIKREVSFKGTNGTPKTLTLNSTVEKDVVFIYNCDILRESEELVDDNYKKSVNFIIEKADLIEKQRREALAKKPNFQSNKDQYNIWVDNYQPAKTVESNHDKVTEGFLSTVIACDPLNTDGVEINLQALRKKFGVNLNESNEAEVELYLGMIVENFNNLYHSFYEDKNEDCYMDTLEEVCEILEQYEGGNWIASELYAALITMYEELEQPVIL